MPEEFRRLIFNDREVISAVMEQARKTKDPVPSGKMMFITIGGDKTPFVQFAIETPEGQKTFKYDGPSLAASLIRFCIEQNIPIPQKAQKLVSAKDQRLIMDIKI